jgi:hypothetical protein
VRFCAPLHSGIGITKNKNAIRQQALDQIFGNLKRSGSRNHKTKHSGSGDEHTEFHSGSNGLKSTMSGRLHAH